MLNLWELMRFVGDMHPSKMRRDEIQRELVELSARGMNGQEISIGSTERGWVIKVHSCYQDDQVTVLVPSDPSHPVEVVSDTRGKVPARIDDGGIGGAI